VKPYPCTHGPNTAALARRCPADSGVQGTTRPYSWIPSKTAARARFARGASGEAGAECSVGSEGTCSRRPSNPEFGSFNIGSKA
jgi:hypothetical protein